ncbi:MAG: saccharopine dehydrogenase C-terminal domain-containing protein [Acidimicrobiia bacterium]|nr:saccharopine dehydrogenase C-terminal domain-containing protein [Acidimicrobiia bacterium]
MTHTYGIIGAGRQGIAAAYDLAVRGAASRIVLADLDDAVSARAAAAIRDLAAGSNVGHESFNAAERRDATSFMAEFDVVLGAASWRLNVGLTEAAIDAGAHFVDLGGNAEVVWAQLAMDDGARAKGVCVVPDCGQVPGTGANLMAHVARSFDVAESVTLYDGGIPRSPVEPWNYQLAFSMDGLTNEYSGEGLYIVDGAPRAVPVFDPDEYELVEFEEFGTLEAFVTAGGLTTLSRTLAGQVRNLKNKTLRYPGHAAQFKAFRDMGLFEDQPIDVGGQRVSPRAVFHTLIEPQIRAGTDYDDVVINRVVGTGTIDGSEYRVTLDVVNGRPAGLPFTAMQAATGWHAAIVMHRLATGRVPPGVTEVENAIEGSEILRELEARGFRVSERREKVSGPRS